MREFLQSWKFKIIICVFALLLGAMIHSAVHAGAASIPEMVLKSITSPFARASTAISSFVESNIDTLINAERYKRENEELREIISELHRQHINIDELLIDNAQLREMLGISESHPDFEWALNAARIRISAWNANDVFGGFTINRGANDGISLHDLVLTGVGVVGIIREVAPHYARVSTIISTETNIGVVAVRGNVTGVLQNTLVYAREGLVRVNFFEKDVDIREGDSIMTRGSGMYPPNLLIGEVVSVHEDPNGVSRYALVQPGEELSGLTHVLVVTGFEGRLGVGDGAE
jgi:rod shape-determining protein MreC